MGTADPATSGATSVRLLGLKFVPVSKNTEVSRHRSVWRLRDEQTVLSEAQERHLMGVAADDEHAKVIGWNFAYGGPLVVRGCGDWGVITRRGRWLGISRGERG